MIAPDLLTRLSDDFLAFCDHFGIHLFDWQRDDFSAAGRRVAGRFVHRLAGVSVPRGDGKSWAGAAFGLWRLLAGRPGTDVISVALDREGARVVVDHARTIIRSTPALQDDVIDERANALLVPATGSRWTVAARDHEDTRGRHPDLVVYDEAGWAADDELFASLLAGQASVPDPLFLVVSTVGRRQAGPLWKVKQLAESDPTVLWRWCGHNRSPLVTQEFLERQRRILMPSQFAREHQNAWVDAADSFTSAAEVDAAMSHGWTQQRDGRPEHVYECFVDLGVVSDPTVIGVGHHEGPLAVVDALLTFQGSRETPVQLVTIEQALRDLAARFRLQRIRIESWQGISAVQSLQRIGLPVELFAPTAKAHADEWPVLAQRLSSRTLVLPPHERLREELLGLVVELGPQGVRVVDRGGVHQDHAVAVRGIVAGLQQVQRATITVARTTFGFAPGWSDAFPVNWGSGQPDGDPLPALMREAKRDRGWIRTTGF